MLSTEEWEAQKRARRLQQLAMARQKKRELAALDKIAIAQGLPKPSLLHRAKKTHPLMVDDKGKLLQGFNAKQYFKNQMVQIPLVELLALSSEYNQQTKEALGFSSKNAKKSTSGAESRASISNNISTSNMAGTCPLTTAGNDTNPEAKASQVLSDPIREVYNTDVVDEHLNIILTNTFEKIVTLGGEPLRVAQVGIMDRNYDAMIDSDAMISIIPMEIIRELKLMDKLVPIKPINLSFAGRKVDSACYVLKDLSLLFSTGLEVLHSMVVVDFPNFPLILGNDFMVGANATLDPQRNELVFCIPDPDNSEEIINQVIIDLIKGNGVNS